MKSEKNDEIVVTNMEELEAVPKDFIGSILVKMNKNFADKDLLHRKAEAIVESSKKFQIASAKKMSAVGKYDKVNEVVVHNQEELNTIPVNFSGTILIELGKNNTDVLYVNCEAPYGGWYADCGDKVYIHVRKMNTRHNKAKIIVKGLCKTTKKVPPAIEINNIKDLELRGILQASVTECSVSLYDNVNLRAEGDSTIIANDESAVHFWSKFGDKIIGYDEYDDPIREEIPNRSKVSAYGKAKIYAKGCVAVEAHEFSEIHADENSTVVCYDNADVRASDNVTVKAYGGKVKVYDDSVSVRRLGPALIY